MMLAAAILAERSLTSSRAFFRHTFCHVDHPIRRGYVRHYLRGTSAAQVPEKIVTRTSLQQKKVSMEIETLADRRHAGAWKFSLRPPRRITLTKKCAFPAWDHLLFLESPCSVSWHLRIRRIAVCSARRVCRPICQENGCAP
jgi:hypothetical protein